MKDFRSERSDSPEGTGRARKVWDAYARTVNRIAAPAIEPAIARYAAKATADLLGFWMSWHLYGGFEGLVETGLHPSTVWRKVRRFRTVFGQHPDEYRFPGVTVDAAAFWDAVRAAGENS